jgi:hypothetical protein
MIEASSVINHSPEYLKFKNSVLIDGTWDDHDYGKLQQCIFGDYLTII